MQPSRLFRLWPLRQQAPYQYHTQHPITKLHQQTNGIHARTCIEERNVIYGLVRTCVSGDTAHRLTEGVCRQRWASRSILQQRGFTLHWEPMLNPAAAEVHPELDYITETASTEMRHV